MNRREFLITSSAAGGLLLLPSCSTFMGFANGRMNIAAIGCGRRAQANIKAILSVADSANAQFSAVCDVDRKRALESAKMIEMHYEAQGYAHKIKVFTDSDELLENSWIDTVVISVPDFSHARVGIAAARRNKDIYIEKPLTYTIEEGQELVREVRKNKLILQTGTQQRSSLYFRRVCEIARNGLLGDLRKVDVYLPIDFGTGTPDPMPVPDNLNYEAWLGDAPFKEYTEQRVHPQADFSRPGWMQIEDYNHGMIANWGAHMLDIVQWGLGTEDSGPTMINATSTYEDRGLWDVHTKIVAENMYANGVTLHLHALEKGNREDAGIRFTGTEQWAFCGRGNFDSSNRELLRWEPGESDITLYKSTHHHRDFLDAIVSRRDPCSPVDVAHRSNSLCVLNAISAKLGREIRWNPKAERFIDDDMANRMLKDMRLRA